MARSRAAQPSGAAPACVPAAYTPVACLLLEPWPLTMLARRHPGVPVAALSEDGRRVLHACPAAVQAGVRHGMREAVALSRCPELQCGVISGPTASAAWNELTETLYARYSDRIDGRKQGLMYLGVGLAAARELAAALAAPVGVAASLEVARLAALRAGPGEAREIRPEDEPGYLPLSLIRHLHVLGLNDEQVARLEFLGVRGLADLMKWSAAQREAFLGVDTGRRLNRFLRGERAAGLPRHLAAHTLSAAQGYDDPLHEPGEAERALAELAPGLYADLHGRTAAYLTLHADTLGGRLSGTRRLKWPLLEAGVRRLALRLLLELGALPLGLDALTLEFSGLQQPSRQIGLWPGPGELDAVREVLDRYPDALVRVEWRDPYAYAADAQYVWVDWLTGSERPGRQSRKQQSQGPASQKANPPAPEEMPAPVSPQSSEQVGTRSVARR